MTPRKGCGLPAFSILDEALIKDFHHWHSQKWGSPGGNVKIRPPSAFYFSSLYRCSLYVCGNHLGKMSIKAGKHKIKQSLLDRLLIELFNLLNVYIQMFFCLCYKHSGCEFLL